MARKNARKTAWSVLGNLVASYHYLLILFVAALLLGAAPAFAGAAPAVTPDQPSYTGAGHAVLSGNGFAANERIALSITRPDGVLFPAPSVTADANGAFSYNYALPAVSGAYQVLASDASQKVTSSFTVSASLVAPAAAAAAVPVPACPSGPDVPYVNAYPSPTNWKLNIDATVNDSCTNITAAEYFFDECGTPGTGSPIYPADDGVFDGDKGTEFVHAGPFDIFSIPDGRHSVFVRGQIGREIWGACNFATFEVDKIAPDFPRDVKLTYAINDTAFVCAQNPVLTAKMCDSQSGINASEYFIDNFGLPNGAGYPMTVGPSFMDGVLICANVTAVIPADQLPEGGHLIKLHSQDNAGNWGKFQFGDPIFFIIDRTPPVTTKEVGEPRVPCEMSTSYYGDERARQCYFVNQSTTITLNASDPIPPDGNYTDHPTIFYRVRYKHDESIIWTDGDWSAWKNYTGPFTFEQDSIHEVEYYSADLCTNQEQHHFEIDVVDSTPPVSTKAFRGPNAGCSIGDDCDNFTTRNTQIILSCQDQQPHPVGGEQIWFRYNVDAGEWTDWNPYDGPFAYPEDSRHELQWYCVDQLGNTEQTHVEVDKVDTQPPIVNKSVGDPKVACNAKGCDWLVNQSTLITLTPQDFGHAENKPISTLFAYCTFNSEEAAQAALNAEILPGGSLPENGECTDWANYTGPFHYAQDSWHVLYYYAIDYVGNVGQLYREFDIVDSQPPVLNKSVGDPKVLCDKEDPLGCHHYITQQTPITLTCQDGQPHPAGHEQIYYHYKINDGQFTDWTLYDGPFTYPQDSRHTLEYYCVDALNNTDGVHTEVDVVDTEHPNTVKTVGDPKVSCASVDDTSCDYYINQQTPITLTANDPQPHPVGGVKTYYWYCVNSELPVPAEFRCEAPYMGPVPAGAISKPCLVEPEMWCSNLLAYNGSFTYPQDSRHFLNYYSVDALGNTEPLQNETDIVDTQPPVINKTIGKPQYIEGVLCVNSTLPPTKAAPLPMHAALTGNLVSTVNFSENCASGIGVGIAFDGTNLWYSCFNSNFDLYRADPHTGVVSAKYHMLGSLGALSYDASRNAIWAGWDDIGSGTGDVYLIQLDGAKNALGITKQFSTPDIAVHTRVDDGIAIDGTDDTLFVSPDVADLVYHYKTDGTFLGSFSKSVSIPNPDYPDEGGPTCGNSGLAIGGDLLYEGYDGCNYVSVVNKTATSSELFNLNTKLAGDEAFRDEDLECDTNTFAPLGKHVMWSMEAYDSNHAGIFPRRAMAFEIPFGSCGTGGQPHNPVCENVTYVNQSTPINFTCQDGLPHPVDHVNIGYRIRYRQDNESPWGAWTDWVVTQGENAGFNFQEDSMHEVQYYCSDLLGNTAGVFNESDIVDSQPPVITKLVGDPKVSCESLGDDTCDWYINQSTPITLTATDPMPHPVGHAVIYFRYKINDGEFTDWMAYNGTFSYANDSRHTLQFYAIDALGNQGPTTTEVDVVDSQAPNSTKTVGDPKVACSKEDPLGCDYYITQNTNIHIACADNEPHPVGLGQICYSWDVASAPVKVDLGGMMTAGKYKLTLYNLLPPVEGGKPIAAFRIYDENGVLIKEDTVEEGTAWNSPSPKGDFLTVRAISVEWEPDEHFASLAFFINGGEAGCVSADHLDLKYPTDSIHTLTYWCADKLGNTEQNHTEIDVVDTQAPDVLKDIGEPKLQCTDVIANNTCTDKGYTYTADADFELGNLVGLEHDTVHDQLQISQHGASTFPVMWIANAAEDSLSKFDTSTNKETARYHTWFGPLADHGDWNGPAPSRTAVDKEGNVYVANRHFDGMPADVIKVLADNWIDRNHNGVIDTSSDLNHDGTISESEMLPMTDSNANDIIDPSEITDERIAWATSVGTNNCLGRSLAIDIDGNIWLGCYNEHAYYELNGTTGAVITGPISVAPNTPYGAAVDKNGILWGASLGSTLLKLDTHTHAIHVYNHGAYGSDYGIALGYDAGGNTLVYQADQNGRTYMQFNSSSESFSLPAGMYFSALGIATDKDGNIVTANYGTSAPTKFFPNGTVMWSVSPQIYTEGRGVIVDSNNDVWVVLRTLNKLAKYSGVDGSPLGTVNTGLGPYTYSDATGLGFRASVSSGTWNVIQDGGVSNATLGPVSWNALIPNGTSMTVEVRSSEDKASWSPWETVTNGTAFSTTPPGRYLEVRVTMQGDGKTSPILYDLTVAGGCASGPSEGNTVCWYIRQDTPITLTCIDPQPHPVGGEKIFWRYNLDGGPWTEWTPYTAPIYFHEDSKHQMEYYCVDSLGNKGPVLDELDKVDSTPPETTKTVLGNHTACTGDECDFYVCKDTHLQFNASDGGPICHVGNVTTYYRYRINDGEWSGWILYNDSDQFLFANHPEGLYQFEYYSADALYNNEESHSELDVFDKQPPKAWVLNPTEGRWFHDGEVFSAYALASDYGNPASGFDTCGFSAISIHFGQLSADELAHVMDLMHNDHNLNDLLAFLGPDRYTLVSLGSVPYADGVCNGNLQIPKESGLLQKTYLVVQITDKSCNTYYDLARDLNNETVLMDIDNTPPLVTIESTQGLDVPTSAGAYFEVRLKAFEVDTQLLQCNGEIQDGNNTFSVFGSLIDDQHCKVYGNVHKELSDGSHTFVLHAMDRAFNTGNAYTTVMVDNTPPLKTIISPIANHTYGQLVPIELNAVDASGVNPGTVQYRVFENLASLFGTPVGPGNYDSGWRTLPLTGGDSLNGTYGADFNTTLEGLVDGKTYYMKARACDNLFTGTLPTGAEIPAHCSDPDITLYVDLSGPTASGSAKMTGTLMTWPGFNDRTGVDHYNVYNNGAKVATTTGNSFDTQGEPGPWTVSAVDTVGNEGAQVSVGTTPTPTPSTPPGGNGGGSGSGSGSGYGGGSGSSGSGSAPKAPTATPKPATVQAPAAPQPASAWKTIESDQQTGTTAPLDASKAKALVGTVPNAEPSPLTALVALGMSDWRYTVLGLGVLALGVLAFLFAKRRNQKPEARTRKGRR